METVVAKLHGKFYHLNVAKVLPARCVARREEKYVWLSRNYDLVKTWSRRNDTRTPVSAKPS